MRVLLDANIFISYLLTPGRSTPPVRIVQAAVLGKYTLLLPEDLLGEFTLKIHDKPYLTIKITPAEMKTMTQILLKISEIIPQINQIPAVTRDLKDDYLLTYAVAGQADYLVTGDKDLLVIKRVDRLKIITPRQFIQRLN